MSGLGNVDVGVVVPDELDVAVGEVLAHDGPAAVAGRVMPLPADHGHARLLSQTTGRGEAIGLGLTLGPGQGPLIDPLDEDAVDWSVGGEHLDEGGRPEPAVDVEGLVVGGVTPSHLERYKLERDI